MNDLLKVKRRLALKISQSIGSHFDLYPSEFDEDEAAHLIEALLPSSSAESQAELDEFRESLNEASQPSTIATGKTRLTRLRESVNRNVGDISNGVASFVDTVERAIIYLDALAVSGMDISPCKECGAPVVCIPDGLPCCEPCAVKEANNQ